MTLVDLLPGLWLGKEIRPGQRILHKILTQLLEVSPEDIDQNTLLSLAASPVADQFLLITPDFLVYKTMWSE